MLLGTWGPGIALSLTAPFPYGTIAGILIIAVGSIWADAILRFIETTAWPLPEKETTDHVCGEGDDGNPSCEHAQTTDLRSKEEEDE